MMYLLFKNMLYYGYNTDVDNHINIFQGFDRQCQSVRNAKYKEAVLKAKLANLETVASRQSELLKEVSTFLKKMGLRKEVRAASVHYVNAIYSILTMCVVGGRLGRRSASA